LTTPLRLAVDLQALQIEGFADRGIGRYIAGATAALARSGRVAAALLAPELPPPSGLPVELAGTGLARWDSVGETRRLLSAEEPLAHHIPAPFLHTAPTDPSVLVTVPHWAETGVPRVVTLHDLIPLRHPEQYLPTAAHLDRYRTRAAWVGSADLILTNSEYTRTEAIDLLDCDPSAVVTVGAGVSSFFTPSDGTDNELFRFWFPGLEHRPFVLTVSGSDARKGTARLIAAVSEVVRAGVDVDLLVVGDLTSTWRDHLLGTAGAEGIEERVVLGGAVGDDLLRACYRRAVVSVMPSVAEGFGLPVLESAACGTPALASSTTALVEVAATTLATFDPTDTQSMATAIATAVTDEERRAEVLDAQRRLAGRSTWDEVARRTIAALDELAEHLPPPTSPARPLPRRLALVGPLPPAGGGIGTHNARLVEATSALVALDTVTPMLAMPDLPPGTGHIPADAFGVDSRPASYDAVVYTLGNSHGHLPTVELALKYPGWLWLHEVRLPAIAVTALSQAEPEAFAARFGWLVERAYPGRAPGAAAQRAGRSVLDLVEAGVGLVPLLAERCRGLLVNSVVARRLVELDLAPLTAHPPIHVLPPPCPPVVDPIGERAPGRGGRGTDEVVAFGIVSMAKRPDLLVDAVALAGCRLSFVGPCPAIMAQVVGDRAEARGIADRVTVTGAVDQVTWGRRLREAALAVQLRDSGSGESSGAVLECLSAGVPVLTNLATAAEYGEGTVAHLPSAEPAVVAERIATLLEDEDQRGALSEAGLDFARRHQFPDLARALVSIVLAG
jgi:glycosyltransferase involved in cell wall biosynthesis